MDKKVKHIIARTNYKPLNGISIEYNSMYFIEYIGNIIKFTNIDSNGKTNIQEVDTTKDNIISHFLMRSCDELELKYSEVLDKSRQNCHIDQKDWDSIKVGDIFIFDELNNKCFFVQKDKKGNIKTSPYRLDHIMGPIVVDNIRDIELQDFYRDGVASTIFSFHVRWDFK